MDDMQGLVDDLGTAVDEKDWDEAITILSELRTMIEQAKEQGTD